MACALWPLHLLMTALVGVRRLGYQRRWWRTTALPVPVIVVGNRVAGGAGKTPTVMAVIEHLLARGWRPGVLSRGYGRQSSDQAQPLVLDKRTQAALNLDSDAVGDEPWLIWRRSGVPMGIGARRVEVGHALLHAHPEIDILVCDDGLQHLALARNLEIVVFDERGAGNGWLLPAGPLRESIDAPPGPGAGAPLVLYNAPAASTPLQGHLAARSLAPLVSLAQWLHAPSQGASAPRPPPPTTEAAEASQPWDPAGVWAVAGIAQPDRFFSALRAQGLHFQPLPLPDHAPMTPLPWPESAAHVVLTEKDAVKIDPAQLAGRRPGTQVWVAALNFDPDAGFWQALDDRLVALRPVPSTKHRAS